MNDRISYIVPAFNAEATLAAAVDSICEGNLEPGDEIVIIDDGSTDRTWEVAVGLKQRIASLLLLRHRHNKGSANAGRNTGIDAANNDLLFNLDADNLLEPGSINPLRQHLVGSGSDVAGFGEIRYFDRSPAVVTTRWIMQPEIDFVTNINRMKETPGSSGNYLYTRASWQRAGRCNESVGGAWDSWAFTCALLATGSRMTTLPGTWYLHRTGYVSTFMRDMQKRNTSLLLLQVLLPYVHLLHPDDVDYLFSAEHRNDWYDRLAERPLQRPDPLVPTNDQKPFPPSVGEPSASELLRLLWRKAKRRVGRTLGARR